MSAPLAPRSAPIAYLTAATSGDPRVEKLARAWCAALGEDPEQLVNTGLMNKSINEFGFEMTGVLSVPRWKTHAREAIKFLTMSDALRP